MIVNRPLPVLLVNVRRNDISGLVDAEADNLYLVAPIGSSLLEHIFIVLHWRLTRWAPSSPKVNEPHLACLVLERHWLAAADGHDVLDWLVHAASADGAGYFYLDSFDAFGEFLDVSLESLDLVLHLRWE